MSIAVPVREYLKFSPYEMLIGLKSKQVVLFEDSTLVELTSREMIVNRYVWEIYSVVPSIPITINHSITKHYTNGIFTSKTLNSCLEVILKDIIELVLRPSGTRALLSSIYKKMYDIFNSIYNEIVYKNIKYATSINILDFTEIQFNSELIAAIKNVDKEKTVDAVNYTYNVLDRIIRTDKRYKNNIIAKGYISGTFKANQVKQILASRGYVTEIDSNIFKHPIASSFVLGMSNLYDIAIESRASAKALYFSNIAVSKSEYLARELQLVTMVVEHLVDGDCGTKDYMDWYVRPAAETGKSDINNLIGKRFFNKETGQEEIITKAHKYLEGTNIKLRTVLSCKHPDKRSVCTACYGELSYAVHDHNNLGHLCSTTLTLQVSQSILSTKHLTSSATSNEIALDNVAKQFFNVKNKNSYAFKAGMIAAKRTSYEMIVEQKDAHGIKDLNTSVDVHRMNPTRISRIEMIIIAATENGVTNYFPIHIKDGNKYGSFTYEFLSYIIQKGYSLDDKDRYVIDLNDWTNTLPVITMPQLEYNFVELNNTIRDKLKYMKVTQNENSETPESLLQSLFDIVNTKLDINLALLEVIVYAFTVANVGNNDYDLGRNSSTKELLPITQLVRRRSLGGGYAHEKVVNYILSPASFYGLNAISHPLDVMIAPNEVIKAKYGTLLN